jgi:hypothetical protein
VLLTPQKALICKFPAIWVNLPETLFGIRKKNGQELGQTL